MSYDLWEEKFEVAGGGTPPRSVSRLTAEMVEAWCIDQLRLPIASAPQDAAFVLRLQCFVDDEEAPGGESITGLSLTALIDRLSRKARDAPSRWEAVSPALRVRDLSGVAGR